MKYCPDCLRWFAELGGLRLNCCPQCLGPLMDRDDEYFDLGGYDNYFEDIINGSDINGR